MSRSEFLTSGAPAGTVFVLSTQVDALLAANLPSSPSNGQTHRISVAGSFENSALVSPQNFAFEVGDYIRYDANLAKWTPVIGNADIDDTAYGSGWNGDTLNAPSRNAVYDKFETLGTMSTQNANNVAITGGAIDGTTIGGTTPAAVTVTTLATGLTADRLSISGIAVAAAGAGSDVNIDLTPKGAGEVNIPKVDIDGGAIDGTTIGLSSPSSGYFNGVTAPYLYTAANAASLTLNLPVTSGTASHTVALNLDSNTVISATATGDDAGGVNARTVTIAASGDTVYLNGSTSIGAGSLNVSGGTLTLAADQISGDKVEGGTINAITINTLTSPSIVTASNASTQTLNIPVADTDAGTHTIALQIDGDSGISVAATGDGAGHVGVKTIDIGTTAEANVIHIGGATALVDITDAHWSITEAGVLSIVSMGANWTNAGRTVADAGTLTTVDINGGSIDGATIGANSAAAVTATSVTTPSVATADNAATLTVNLPVTGTDNGSHTVAIQLDGNTLLSGTATGNGAGAVGARTITVGASGDSISLAGTTTAATAASGTNTTQVATTAFSNAAAIKYSIVFGG